MENRISLTFSKHLFSLLFVLTICTDLSAQNYAEKQEVTLSFSYRGLINHYINSYYSYDTEEFYLPVTSIFRLLKVPHDVNGSTQVINGSFPDPSDPFSLDFNNATLRVSSEEYTYDRSKFMLGELDYYVTPDVLNELFGVSFRVDFNNLMLSLKSDMRFEVEKAFEREQIRKRRLNSSAGIKSSREYYPLMFDRDWNVVSGFIMDYSLNSSLSDFGLTQNGVVTLGGELLGGDIQGSAFGSISSNNTALNTNNVRWRYVLKSNPFLTKIRAGQVVSDGITSKRHVGVQLSNEPIEPKVVFNQYTIEGQTQPQSEVELYSNNTLIDFTETDESGHYRFQVPLTYGNPRYQIIIYRPDGSVEQVNRRFQIPFSFQQPGNLVYNINAGKYEDFFNGSNDENYLYQGELSYGINNWLTANFGVEHLTQSYEEPFMYSSLSTRIGSNYLVNVDYSPDFYTRINTRVIYPSSTSFSFSYANYQNTELINSFADQEYRGTIFIPFYNLGLPISLRLNGNYFQEPNIYRTLYRIDLIGSVKRLRFQLGFNDRQFNQFELTTTENSQSTLAMSYSIPRSRDIASALRGVFFRGQFDYYPGRKTLNNAQFQFSKPIGSAGQLQLTLGRNFTGSYNYVNASLTIDFGKVRSITNTRTQRSNYNIQQSFSGSLAYDKVSNSFVADGRSQVGKSAATFRLFKDENNSGSYDEGEELISNDAITIERSARMIRSNDDYARFNQIQPYIRTNARINKANITDPILAPEFEEFSFYSTPNRFKSIDIPFYISGIIDGMVTRTTEKEKDKPVSGLRMYLVQQDGDYRSDFLTYNDGSFYQYEIPPGDYILFPDASQLNYLNAEAEPDTLHLTIEALSEGDFIEELNFSLAPREPEPEEFLQDSSVAAREVGLGAADINGDKDSNAVTSINLNYSITIDSLKNDTHCSYALQLHNYSTPVLLKEQLDANNAKNSRTYLNADSDSYFGYFHGSSSLSNSYRQLSSLNTLDQSSLLKICGTLPVTNIQAISDQYYLQFGAFGNEADAATYARELSSQYSLDTFVEQDASDQLYKVRTGYFNTRTDAQVITRQINEKTANLSSFIGRKESVLNERYTALDLDYQLILGNFETTRKASLYAIRIDEAFDLKSRIVIDKDGTVLLMLKSIYAQWEDIRSIRDQISTDPTFENPVILSVLDN